MKKFLIKREISDISKAPKNELDKAGKASEEVLIKMRSEGKEIQQEQSFVVGNAIYCVYNSESEDLIYEHAERSKGIVTEISQISTIIKHNTSVIS